MTTTNTSKLIDALISRRDTLTAQYDRLVAAHNFHAADDMAADLSFAIRQAHDALMGR